MKKFIYYLHHLIFRDIIFYISFLIIVGGVGEFKKLLKLVFEEAPLMFLVYLLPLFIYGFVLSSLVHPLIKSNKWFLIIMLTVFDLFIIYFLFNENNYLIYVIRFLLGFIATSGWLIYQKWYCTD